MSEERQASSVPEERDPKRMERAHRILDATSALILRWGYDKTTIDDISRQAGVAKGTIYLHWKTRDDLFVALMKREKADALKELFGRITQDPAGWTLRDWIRHSVLVGAKRPLIQAFYMANRDVIGKLAQKEIVSVAYAERIERMKFCLETLRDYGLVRTDLSLQQELYIVSAAMSGFLLVTSLLPDSFSLSDEAMADLISETVSRTLGTGGPVTPDVYRAVSETLTQYMEHSVADAEEQSLNGMGV